tara:strand:+ start:308 stop:1465 length:1158 start_codon:yes stop_codon:yes gene_type:complete
MSWWTSPNLQPKIKSKFVVVFGGSFYLPNVKSLNKPKIDFDTKEYRLLNHKFNYPGNGTWQPITIKFVDMNGMGMQTEHFDTGAFLWQIMNNTGYTYPHVNNSQFRDPHFRNVNPKTGQEFGGGHHIATKINFRDDPDTQAKEFDTWKTITTPEKSSTIANSFGLGLTGVADFKNASTAKQKISIYQISPDKKITECWHLINPIVKTIGWGDLDYSADDLVEYELGVVYDWAVMDRTQIGKPMNVDELSYKEFMKTLFVDNEEAIMDERERAILEAVPELARLPEGSSMLLKDFDLEGGGALPQPGSGGLSASTTGGDFTNLGGDVSPLGDVGEVSSRTEGTERLVGGTPEIQRRGIGGTVDPLPSITNDDTRNPFDRTTPIGQE